jgi:hypothetical protein
MCVHFGAQAEWAAATPEVLLMALCGGGHKRASGNLQDLEVQAQNCLTAISALLFQPRQVIWLKPKMNNTNLTSSVRRLKSHAQGYILGRSKETEVPSSFHRIT